jgi:PhnB protein
MPVKPIPDGYHTFTPYYVVDGASEFIDFLVNAFGGKEHFRMPMPNGKLGHAEVRIGDSMVMLADQSPAYGAKSMQGMLYVADCDAVVAKAVAAGAEIVRPLENQFYGDRSASLKDKWGNDWTVSTHVEDVSPEEIDRRMKALKH